MKRLVLGFLLLAFTSAVLAQTPDPRDSIILESKTVAPGAHPPKVWDTTAYLYIRVWITNKDSLGFINLVLVQRSLSGGARVEFARGPGGVYNRLTNTLTKTYECFGSCYDSDSFWISGSRTSLATTEPPNLTRKPFWELKFDSVLNGPGITELDTGSLVSGFFYGDPL